MSLSALRKQLDLLKKEEQNRAAEATAAAASVKKKRILQYDTHHRQTSMGQKRSASSTQLNGTTNTGSRKLLKSKAQTGTGKARAHPLGASESRSLHQVRVVVDEPREKKSSSAIPVSASVKTLSAAQSFESIIDQHYSKRILKLPNQNHASRDSFASGLGVCRNASECPRRLKATSGVVTAAAAAASASYECPLNVRSVPWLQSRNPEYRKTPKDHQIRAAIHFQHHKTLLAGHPTGSGKTLLAVLCMQGVLHQEPSKKCILVTPLSVRNQIKAELLSFRSDTPLDEKMMQAAQEMKDEKFNATYPFMKPFVFHTPQSFTMLMNDATSSRTLLENCFLVVDEAHTFISLTSQQTNKMIEACSLADKVLLLTATIMMNAPKDLCAILAMLYQTGKVLDPDEFQRRAEIALERKHDNAQEQLSLLQSLFRGLVSLHNVVKTGEYPVQQPDVAVAITMTPEFEKYYTELIQTKDDSEKARTATRKKTVLHAKSDFTAFYNGLRMLVNLGSDAAILEAVAKIRSELHSAAVKEKSHDQHQRIVDSNSVNETPHTKIAWIRKFLDDMKNEKHGVSKNAKVLIYSEFIEAGIMQVEPVLRDDLKMTYSIITGKTKESERTAIISMFNENNLKTQVLLVTGAGGTGLDLKRLEYIIKMEPGWNEVAALQVDGRGSRLLSHANLPEERRQVKTFTLILEKQNEPRRLNWYDDAFDYHAQDKSLPDPSVDHLKYYMSKSKGKQTRQFLNLVVAPVSIERQCRV